MRTGPSPELFSKVLDPTTLDALAKASGLIERRSRRFSASGFLCSVLQAVVTGAGSLSQLVEALGGIEEASMSRQALAKRFSPASTRFFSAVIARLVSELNLLPSEEIGRMGIGRILVEDSTIFGLHSDNAAQFQGTGGNGGPGAAAKIDLVYDLLSGRPVAAVTRNGSDPDQGYSQALIDWVGPGDLVLRDRGYFSLDALVAIDVRNAIWISRLPASVKVISLEGILIEEVLSQTDEDQVELEVRLGASHQIPCRLVARRLDPTSSERSRRMKNKVARDHGKTASRASLIQAGWQILLTNGESSQLDVRKLFALYAWRWQIEIQFRAIKQSSNAARLFAKKRGAHQLEALVQALLIFTLHCLELNRRVATRWRSLTSGKEISVEKIALWLAKRLRLINKQALINLLEFDLCNPRCFLQEKRKKRKPLTQRVQDALNPKALEG